MCLSEYYCFRESRGAARRDTWRNVLHTPRLVACANRAATKLQQSCNRATAARRETFGASNTPGFLGIQ